jgi:hypothetical protein
MDGNSYIDREISWLELNRRVFAIVRAISNWFLGNSICFLSRLNDRRVLQHEMSVVCLFLKMTHYHLIQSFVSCYLPLKSTYTSLTILS